MRSGSPPRYASSTSGEGDESSSFSDVTVVDESSHPAPLVQVRPPSTQYYPSSPSRSTSSASLASNADGDVQIALANALRERDELRSALEQAHAEAARLRHLAQESEANSQESVELRAEVQRLQGENQMLKQQVLKMQSVIHRHQQ